MSEHVGTAHTKVAGVGSPGSFLEVLWVSLRLGLTSFGGPIAHLGYFHAEYVKRRKWIDEQSYADFVALCQFLPGPASSQVSIAIGCPRASPRRRCRLAGLYHAVGADAHRICIRRQRICRGRRRRLAARPQGGCGGGGRPGGLGNGRSLCPDRERATIAVAAALVTLAWPTAAGQLSSIAIAGVTGAMVFSGTAPSSHSAMRFPVAKTTAITAWSIFFALLVGLPLLRQMAPSHADCFV